MNKSNVSRETGRDCNFVLSRRSEELGTTNVEVSAIMEILVLVVALNRMMVTYGMLYNIN